MLHPTESMPAPIAIVAAQDGTALRLRGDISVRVATELAEAAHRAAARGLPTRLICCDMTSIDVAALQVLVALRQAGDAGGWSVTFEDLSPDVIRQIDLAGFSSFLFVAAAVRTV
jgi:anti-anti-sigma factor